MTAAGVEPMSKPKPGHAIMVLGQTGTGKSMFCRQALLYHGSGAVALAPSWDEVAMYEDLMDHDSYHVKGFDHYREGQQWLKRVYMVNKQALEKEGETHHKVLVTDTLTGFDELSAFEWLDRFGTGELPKPRSPEGADFYSNHRMKLEFIVRWCRAIKGLGLHWLATAHVYEKPMDDETTKGVVGENLYQPVFRGSYRDQALAPYDVAAYTYATRQGFHLLWKPRKGRPAKSRIGPLADDDLINVDAGTGTEGWERFLQAVDAAKERRAAQGREALA